MVPLAGLFGVPRPASHCIKKTNWVYKPWGILGKRIPSPREGARLQGTLVGIPLRALGKSQELPEDERMSGHGLLSGEAWRSQAGPGGSIPATDVLQPAAGHQGPDALTLENKLPRRLCNKSCPCHSSISGFSWVLATQNRKKGEFFLEVTEYKLKPITLDIFKVFFLGLVLHSRLSHSLQHWFESWLFHFCPSSVLTSLRKQRKWPKCFDSCIHTGDKEVPGSWLQAGPVQQLVDLSHCLILYLSLSLPFR